MGSATLEGRIDMGEKVIINIRAFIDGHRPPDRVLPSMLSQQDGRVPPRLSGANSCNQTGLTCLSSAASSRLVAPIALTT